MCADRKMKAETNGINKISDEIYEESKENQKHAKGSKSTNKTSMVIFVLVLVIALVVSTYFAVRPTTNDTSAEIAYEWAALNSTDLLEVAPNVSMADLKRSILRRFQHPTCRGDKNWFQIAQRCYYVFTDHPPEWYIMNGCKLFTGVPIYTYDYTRFGLQANILPDFKTCCLNYFNMNDTEWWRNIDGALKNLTFRNLVLDYRTHLNRHPLPVNPILDTRYNCSLAWGAFDEYWQSVNCSLWDTYSQICIETRDEQMLKNNEYIFN